LTVGFEINCTEGGFNVLGKGNGKYGC